ncbi:MAG: transposase, partial [Lentisphaerota bacterium]
MARPLRIEYPGACYHVVNRGNQRNRIFFSPMHYELFLEKLCGFSEQFGVSTRCYCIMPNH